MSKYGLTFELRLDQLLEQTKSRVVKRKAPRDLSGWADLNRFDEGELDVVTCDACGNVVRGEYVAKGGRWYHEQCYAELPRGRDAQGFSRGDPPPRGGKARRRKVH